MAVQASAIADLKSELEALRDDKEMFLLRNQSLEEELQKQKLLIAAHHKYHAMTLHHAHHHNVTCPHHHAWWLLDKSNFEVCAELINAPIVNQKVFILAVIHLSWQSIVNMVQRTALYVLIIGSMYSKVQC